MKKVLESFMNKHNDCSEEKAIAEFVKDTDPTSAMDAVEACDNLADAAGRVKCALMEKVTGYKFTCTADPDQTFDTYRDALDCLKGQEGAMADDGGRVTSISLHQVDTDSLAVGCREKGEAHVFESDAEIQSNGDAIEVTVTCRKCGAVGNINFTEKEVQW